jgi:hypothetical protein
MTVEISPSPNPNALKFTVGRDVGGPKTFVAGREVDDPLATQLLELPGVNSVFMTADFVTLSKDPDAPWEDIAGPAKQVLEAHFA